MRRDEHREQDNQSGAGSFAGAIARHVHDGLGGPLGRLRQRRVQELVAGAENRVADRDVQAARQHAPPRKRHHEPGQRGRADDDRVTGDGSAKSEPHQYGTPDGGLDQDRRDAGGGVEQSEEPHERLAFSEVTDRLDLEQVVHQRRHHRRQCDDEGQIPQQGLTADVGPGAAFVRRASPRAPRRRTLAEGPGSGNAGAAHRGEDEKERAAWQQRGRALGPEAPGEPAERRGAGHAGHQLLG